jgi:RNA recognition motif-containing protein
MIMNIHITNLSFNIIEGDLLKLFSVYGLVGHVVILRDRINGRSKGNAFVEMPIQAQGEQAILGLDRTELDGKKIGVREMEYRAGEFNN